MIGYAFCGSFCTHSDSVGQLERLVGLGYDVVPILSENAYSTDTRFGKASDFVTRVEGICKKRAVHTIKEAEPFGPSPLEALIICPCTGNTLAKIASGISDTAVTMAAKAHLRADGPLLIALASNDAASQNLKNVATLLARKSVYFLPMRQDNPQGKPHSLVADFARLPLAFEAMLSGVQLRPLFV